MSPGIAVVPLWWRRFGIDGPFYPLTSDSLSSLPSSSSSSPPYLSCSNVWLCWGCLHYLDVAWTDEWSRWVLSFFFALPRLFSHLPFCLDFLQMIWLLLLLGDTGLGCYLFYRVLLHSFIFFLFLLLIYLLLELLYKGYLFFSKRFLFLFTSHFLKWCIITL